MSEKILNQILEKVTDLDSKVTKLDTKVTRLESKVDHLDQRVGSLEVKVDHLDQRLGNLEVKVETLSKDVETIKVEQSRHGDLLHQLISTVGANGKRQSVIETKQDELELKQADLNVKQSELRREVEAHHDLYDKLHLQQKRDIEFVYHEMAKNKLEMNRLRQYA